MSVNYTQQKSVYDSDLRKSMSQLQYLESTLRRKADGADADADAETDIVECPICIAPFINSSTEICVWPCGHRTCVTCVLRLVRRARAAHDCVFCVTCRSRARRRVDVRTRRGIARRRTIAQGRLRTSWKG